MGKRRIAGVVLLLVFVTFANRQCYPELAKKSQEMSWKDWDESVRAYREKISLFHQQQYQIEMEATNPIQEAIRAGNQALLEEVANKAINKYSSLLEELINLSPPEELKAYHQKKADAFKYRKMLQEAFLKKDSSLSLEYNRRSLMLEKEAMEELRRVAIKYNPPENVIEDMNKFILGCERVLKEQ